MGSGPSTPREDPTSRALRRRQFEQLAELDEEQNTKFKRLLNSAAGVRAFQGSAASRRDPSDSAAGPAPPNYGLVQSNARGLPAGNERLNRIRRAFGGNRTPFLRSTPGG